MEREAGSAGAPLEVVGPAGRQDRAGGYVEFGWTTWEMGGYLQDDYRVSKDLTLNIGFRYDYYTVPQEIQGRVYNRGIDPNNPQ